MLVDKEIDAAPRATAATWVELGRVVKAAGLDGGLFVKLYGDDPQNLLAAPEVRLQGRPGAIPFRVDRAEAAGVADGHARARLWLSGLCSRSRVEAWLGARIEVRESELATLPEGEYYWRDLLGLRVRTSDGRELGRVEEIWPTDGHDILVVSGGGRRLLVPALREIVASVDPSGGEIRIETPPGLLPEDA